MSRTSAGFVLAASLLAALTLPTACGDDTSPARRASTPVPASDEARAAMKERPLAEWTLDEVLDRFDVDGDGAVTATDAQQLATCVEAGADLEGLGCDLVTDGVIDEQDRYLLAIVLGGAVARDPDRIRDVAGALRRNADGEGGPSLSEVTHDWNADGLFDAADVRALAAVLEGDLLALDLTADGKVDFGDVNELAAAQARAVLGRAAAPSIDLDGDGVSDATDLLLLGEVSLFTSDTSLGVLDNNLDGAIDDFDFCSATDSAEQPNFLGVLMPVGDAEAAFAAATPRFSLCRSDGRATINNANHGDTPFVARISPRNLYLNEVDGLPEGYSLVDPSVVEGRRLFVVSTTPSERPLLWMGLPWDPSLEGGDTVSFRFSGEDLPEAASLLLPHALVDADAPVERKRTPRPRLTLESPLPAIFADGDDVRWAEQLNIDLFLAESAFEELITGCPCTLPTETRNALVSYLLRSNNCVASTLGVSRAELAFWENELARAARLHILMSHAANRHWRALRKDQWTMVIAKALLQVAEVGYELFKNRAAPGKGIKDAAEGVASDILGDQLGKVLLGDEADAGVSTALEAGTEPLTDAVAKAMLETVKDRAKIDGFKAFSKLFLDVALKEMRKDPSNLAKFESLVKTLIKAMPALYLQHAKLVTMEAELASVESARLYNQGVHRVGNLRRAVATLADAEARLADLRAGFLEKLADDGCPVTVSTTDPCSFDLESAIALAAEELAEDDQEAAEAITAAQLGLRLEETTSACFGSLPVRALDAVAVDLAGISTELSDFVQANGAASGAGPILERLRTATDQRGAAETDLAAVCQLLFENDLSAAEIDAMKIAEARRLTGLELYRDAVETAVEEYLACIDGAGEAPGACAYDPEVALASPWEMGAKCVGCLPSFAMDCCGDARLQEDEECDPGSSEFTCDPGTECQTCQCEPSSTVPPDVIDLGAFLGASVELLDQSWVFRPQEECVHSAVDVPSKPVANDHTTIDGHAAFHLDVDDALVRALICGPNGIRYVICPSGGLPLVAGPGLVIILDLDGELPMNDSGNIYQYGFVFDSDGLPGNNYVPQPAYANDFFGGTDLWIEANRTGAGAWSTKATDASDGFDPVPTRAHVVAQGTAMAVIIPQDEIEVVDPDFRASAFRHTGDYGIPPPHDWDGSVNPPVAEGLDPFPGQ